MDILGLQTGLPGLGDQNVSSYGCPALPLPHDPRNLLEVRWKLIKLAPFSVMWPNLCLWRLKKILIFFSSCIERSERRQHSCLQLKQDSKKREISPLWWRLRTDGFNVELRHVVWALEDVAVRRHPRLVTPAADQWQSRSIHATPKSKLEPLFVSQMLSNWCWETSSAKRCLALAMMSRECCRCPVLTPPHHFFLRDRKVVPLCRDSEGSSTPESSYLPTLLEERVLGP